MEHTESKISEQSIQKGQFTLEEVKSSATERQGIIGIQHQKSDIAIVTPEKTSGSPSISCYREETNQLPEKYWSILEFFNQMTSSLRLLGLHKRSPSFQNICSQVERMTGRKFEYKHLAQIKYILPEAIQINKILVHDTETMCMKPEIKVTLLFDVVEGHCEPSAFIALSNAFASRLENFLSTQPEGQTCDVPEASLPEPFNQMDIIIKEDQLPVELLTIPNKTEQVKLSNLGPSFNRCFSGKATGTETEETRPFAFPSECSVSNSDRITDQEIEKTSTDPDISVSSISSHSVKATMPENGISDSTPMKAVTENDDLLLETPALPTPKRALPTCEDKEKTIVNEFPKASTQTAKRSLDFSNLDDGESSLSVISHEMQQNTILLSTSGQMKGEKDNLYSVRCQMSNQGYMRADEETSVSLSDLILTIHHVFQSVNCRSITKEELVHKIIMNNCDIDENSNIEEQIGHLEKLVPDWIHKQVTTSGDVLYNISMAPDLKSVCERVIRI